MINASMCKVALSAFLVLAPITMALSAQTPLPIRTREIAQRYNIGLQLYTVRDQCAKDFPGTLKVIADIGFVGVEFAGYYGRSASDLKKLLRQDHLKCLGTHVQLDDLQGENLEKTVSFSKALGNDLIVVAWLPESRRNSVAALEETQRILSDAAKRLRKSGITLAYHNHAFEFQKVDGKLIWDRIFLPTNPDLAIQFDTGNALEGGAQASPFLTTFPGRVVSVHVKDYSASNANALLGEGDERWSEVIPILYGKHRPKRLIIEQEKYPYPSLECARRCLINFEKMLTSR